MADEIAQVVGYEIDGMKFVFKGGIAAARVAITMLKWMCSERYEQGHVLSGDKTFKTILKMSKPDGPSSIMIDRDIVEVVAEEAKKQGVHFHRAADFNPNSGQIAFFIPPKEVSILTAIYKQAAAKEIEKDKVKISEYTTQETDLAKQIEEATARLEELKVQYEHLKQAKAEVETDMRDFEEVINSDKLDITYQEFLATLKGSEFEKDPDLAFTRLCKGVDNPPEVEAKEALMPIRSEKLAPKSGLHYYLPEYGAVITRQFKKDTDGFIYSDFWIKKQNGEIFKFTDKGYTNEDFERIVLPDMLDKAGILEDTKVKVFENDKRLRVYLHSVNSIKAQSEVNIEEKLKKGEPVFSSAETEKEIKHAINNYTKEKVFAEMEKENVTLWVDSETLGQKGGKYEVTLENGEALRFGEKNVQSFGKERNEFGQTKLSVSKGAVLELGGKEMKAEDIAKIINSLNSRKSSSQTQEAALTAGKGR